MTRQIARRFLVSGTGWQRGVTGIRCREGALSSVPARLVVVRTEGDRAALVITGLTPGGTRIAFEHPIPIRDATVMLDALCERPLIEQTRYYLTVGQHLWEIDELHGDQQGLLVATVELRSADEPFVRPEWASREMTGELPARPPAA